ncbi:RNA polymerase sigma factor [Aequorivita vladivostokensis]|jgi:RNA polymerase sigma-70 factor (family 1)|uniref:RNA polymerase sigma-70 factor n=1 Tax=Aequorivita vladivostokensis TaxID=171194 RepID=A0ABR5DGN0_9FLAO|nr:RNA polymerase sigma-70 factor [Aequorivita vladivostokensis]MAB58200.1 RNA polymerase sigma-70 factor [Aequorivita sp.]MAK36951.1 RNA polymerase sigma-70 factor [Flavobacteriaceae bacterium]KJJ37935.1 RNA polymerase sigma-70 factor [Aequorivita vladivostokensis]MAO48329.1 RNA polymerase sigma-70 factor [Aequorivita sp.]MBF32327.1 RNA polymerase sigma-70 factor [Aequorivita sp.]|tara:strand:- start:46187 stop:46696 length:510 start_codon:yes stop_codon:yes gene_type:complete
MKQSENVCNENTFNQLYEVHGKPVWRFIYFRCGDPAQADDLVQEAFIKLWQNCAKVTREKAKSFLYTVCNNAFLNEVAHKKVVLKHAKRQADKTNYQSPEFLMEEDEFREKLKKSLENLTEAQRTAFLLNRIEGKKYAEIAQMLNISVKAVEKRMSQALAVLRKEIGNV